MNALNQSFYELSNIDNESCASTISSYDDNSYNGGSMNNDQNEDGEQYLELNDDNYEFVQFKENVKEWLNIDDDIITLQNAIKDRKKRKNDLTPKIMSFMDEYKINDLNTKNGKIKFTKSLYTKPLNKNYLISKLADYLRDANKAEKATMFIMENREKMEKSQLRRVGVKKEINI
jgi:hypothetical protein